MTADFFSFNKNFVQKVSNKIINSVSGINRATTASKGKLCSSFSYLENFIRASSA